MLLYHRLRAPAATYRESPRGMVTRSAAGSTRLNSSMIIRSGVKVFSPVIKSVGTFNPLTNSRSSIGNGSCEMVSAFHSRILLMSMRRASGGNLSYESFPAK